MFLGTFAWSSVDVSRPFLGMIGYQEVVG